LYIILLNLKGWKIDCADGEEGRDPRFNIDEEGS
jgi:hypothetical protein